MAREQRKAADDPPSPSRIGSILGSACKLGLLRDVMLNTEDIHPVLPAPVETSTPLDDCASAEPFQTTRYRAETCDCAPRNRSLKASSRCPSLSFASASVTARMCDRPSITLSSGTLSLLGMKVGSRMPSKRSGSGFTFPMIGCAPAYFAVFATSSSCPRATITSPGKECERRHQTPIDHLRFQPDVDRTSDNFQRPPVGLILVFVFLEIST